MDLSNFKGDMVCRGTSGRVWVNDSIKLNVKKFEVKIEGVYETVDSCNPIEERTLVGLKVTGSMTLSKVDSMFASILADEWKKLKHPDVSMVASIQDANGVGYEKIKLTGITYDDLKFGFEVKKLLEDDASFQATNYDFIDKIA